VLHVHWAIRLPSKQKSLSSGAAKERFMLRSADHAIVSPSRDLVWTGVVPPVLCRSSGEGLKHSWAHVQPHYTQAAMEKALEEAMAFGEALSNPWNLKVTSAAAGDDRLSQPASASVTPPVCCSDM
jgi:hypothetical protein